MPWQNRGALRCPESENKLLRDMGKMAERELMLELATMHFGPGPLIRITDQEVITLGSAQKQIGIALKFADEVGQAIRIMVDINPTKRPPTLARRAFLDLTKDERVHKLALYGMNPVARAIATFFVRAASKKKVSFFANAQDAQAWLESEESRGGDPS